jgi:hypothetical protein
MRVLCLDLSFICFCYKGKKITKTPKNPHLTHIFITGSISQALILLE